MRRTESFPLTIEAVEEATLMVQQCLRESRFSSKESMKAALVTEEAISSLVSHGVGMVMGIGPVLGMFMCMTNCLGDVVVSAIVARRCGEIDLKVYAE